MNNVLWLAQNHYLYLDLTFTSVHQDHYYRHVYYVSIQDVVNNDVNVLPKK